MQDLTLYIDFKSPESYLALNPTSALIERLQTRVKWRPFITKPRTVPSEKANETRGETHIRVREEARQNTHKMYAAIQQLDLIFPAKPGNTDIALAALLYTQPDPLPFIRNAFAGYWTQQLDLNNATIVTNLLTQSGYDVDGFDVDHYLGELKLTQQSAEENGIVDAPAYVVQDQLFIGREHLPWVNELLTQS